MRQSADTYDPYGGEVLAAYGPPQEASEFCAINADWDWYLERAWRTGVAMAEQAPRYAQFGQMDGKVFLLVLHDLHREGWTEQARGYPRA